MIGLYVLGLFIISKYEQLSFTLDAEITEMCFFVRGSTIGKTLIMDYEIIGKSVDNVKFLVQDFNDKENILIKENQGDEGKQSIIQNVNYKHDFIICWKNKDSEMKQVSFYYKHQDVVEYMNTSILNREC